MSRHRTLPLFAGSLLCASMAAVPPALAQGAHEHGVTYLDVILDGSALAIDLRGAGHHLVGFEHAPETAEQLAAWQATIDGLGDAGALFVMPPQSGCSLQSAEVTPPAFDSAGSATSEAATHEHAHHDKHGHGHDHGHAGDHAHRHDGDDHDHDHDHAHAHADQDGSHGHAADWQVRYRFECSDAGRLTAIEVGLFTAFPAHEEVRYQRFSDSGQDGGTLRPGRTRLPLR